ncbi:GxxExxY protein [Spirosoma pollinicola]|uniref:GxxExxY protein n=1 Tax=Spirosoma pollinicola TaxID=2057025 RepID=A0A2K8Z3B5_9BACT|nr:GxxExxY protein [Spirosoma pollinicola]AUD04355.1 GxxExxY protein [Spirosoma pollinicola]
MPKLLHRELTDAIIGIYYDVFNELGYGFLERVYQNAMYAELKNEGFDVTAQQQIKVYYKGLLVGDYFADLLIDNCIILELKATESLAEEHEVQLLNYLRATDIEVGLLLNFGKKPEFKRLVYTNNRKRLRNC